MKKALIFFVLFSVVLATTVGVLIATVVSKGKEIEQLKGHVADLTSQVVELTPHKVWEINNEQSVIYLSLSSYYFYSLEEAATGNLEYSGGKVSESAMASLFGGYDSIVYFDQSADIIGVHFISICEITLADNNDSIVVYHLPGEIYVPVVTSAG